MSITDTQIQEMFVRAKKARLHAFTPRSDHNIGACVLTSAGNYYEGCNVESNISGLGLCAERAALDHAVIHGEYVFDAVLTLDSVISPTCGVCLQYMVQFFQITDRPFWVISADLDGQIIKHDLFELIPKAYLSRKSVEKLKRYSAGSQYLK